MTPSQLTARELKKEWPLWEKTEHWNGFCHRRQDLFGFADFVAVRGNEVLLVQATSASNMSARVHKIRSLPAHQVWLESPNRFIEVWGWAKRDGRWQVRKQRIERE